MSAKPHLRLKLPAPAADVVNVEVLGAHDAASATLPAMRGWAPMLASADADTLHERDTVVARSRDVTRNNPAMAGFARTFSDNVLGHVLRLQPQPDWRALGRTEEWARDWATQARARFRSWAETTACDVRRQRNLLQLTDQALLSTVAAGDAPCVVRWRPRPWTPWRTCLQLIDSDRLSTPFAQMTNPRIRGGIEFDASGAPLWYHFRDKHPGDFLLHQPMAGLGANQWRRVPAFRAAGRRGVILLSNANRIEQSRGMPAATAVMNELRMAGVYTRTELETAAASSLIAGFLESALDQETLGTLFGADPAAADGFWKETLRQYHGRIQSGALIPVPLGAKVTPFVPQRGSGFKDFMEYLWRYVAAGLNVPYELLVKDFSKTNYSSARAAMNEAWRFTEGRRAWLKSDWLNPIYELWLEEDVNGGGIEAPDFYQNRYAWSRCDWLLAGRGYVDPDKERKAEIAGVANMHTTLEDVLAARGIDYDDHMSRVRRERADMETLGFDPVQALSVTPPAAPQEEIPA